MASSRKLNLTDLSDRVAEQIAPLLPARSSILIGLSGGVDSVVLLHLLHRLAPRFFWKLSAVHVHHGLSQNANAWADFCVELCVQYAIPLQIERVDIAPLRAHGIEAAARKLRHAAFSRQASDFVALAHHADDQAETLLLQLLRGAGVRGASAMPVLSTSQREGAHNLVRPLLRCSRREILDYAAAHDLRWIEDESNADDAYPRNFLRRHLLPLLEQKFPAYRDTLTRSAQHFAEASELLDDLARLDGADSFPSPASGITSDLAVLPPSRMASGSIRGVRGEGGEPRLEVSRLQSLSHPRAKNLLRYFLHSGGAPLPQAAQLDDMLHQLCDAREDATVCISYGDCWEVRRYQGEVYILRALGEFDRDLVLPWHGEAELDWPALHTRLRFNHSHGVGISLAKLQRAPVTLRLRQGGEALRPQKNAALRTLKNLLQEQHIPPWQRERLPLLYCGDELVCVPGVAVAAAYQTGTGEAVITLGIV